MSLSVKFNLVLVLTFLAGMIAAGYISDAILQRNARDEILHTASIIMENAMAVRSYTVNEVKPLLIPVMHDKFLPQTVPAYAAMRNVQGLREKFPEYTYKEATLNPTNPTSRATDWETTIIEYFRNNGQKNDLVGVHQTALGPQLYMARPIQVQNAECLMCHGDREAAPAAMLARYGDRGGFGWNMDEIVGAQIVSVPMSVALQRASMAFQTFMLALAGIFVVLAILLNLLLRLIVLKPIKRLSAMANDISMGNQEVPEFKASGNDELSVLGESFNRMRRSLDNAMKMLDE